MYQDDYREILNNLEDEGFIKSYVDNSTEYSFDFMLDVPRSTTQASPDELKKKLKLISRETETLTMWTHDHKMKIHPSTASVIKDFVEFRLKKYEDRRVQQIKLYKEEVVELKERRAFIDFYIKNSAAFSKKTKAEISAQLAEKKFVNIDRLLQIRIYSLTQDEINRLEEEIKRIEIKITQLESTTAKDIYEQELNSIKI